MVLIHTQEYRWSIDYSHKVLIIIDKKNACVSYSSSRAVLGLGWLAGHGEGGINVPLL